jgi:hypothetical protein
MKDAAHSNRLSTVERLHDPEAPPGGLELSENKLREMAAALHAPDPYGRRSAMRVPVEGFVTMAPLPPAPDLTPQRVGVYDLSRSGVAIVVGEPIDPGTKFNLLFARSRTLPLEVLCTARHCRREGAGYIIGAEFGVSWMDALLGAMAGPPEPAAPAGSSN